MKNLLHDHFCLIWEKANERSAWDSDSNCCSCVKYWHFKLTVETSSKLFKFSLHCDCVSVWERRERVSNWLYLRIIIANVVVTSQISWDSRLNWSEWLQRKVLLLVACPAHWFDHRLQRQFDLSCKRQHTRSLRSWFELTGWRPYQGRLEVLT